MGVTLVLFLAFRQIFGYDIIVIKYGRKVQAVAVQFSRQLLLHKMQHTLDLTENLAMQDLVRTIAEEMKVSPEGAVVASITRENLRKAVKEGYGSIAVGQWGHDSGFEFTPLESCVLRLDFPEPETKIDDVIFEFLIFQAESLGFHI